MGIIGTSQPISLRRRLIIQLGSMIVALILLSVGAIVGINGLHHEVGDALQGYHQLRTVYEIGQAVQSARNAIESGTQNTQIVRGWLQSAILKLQTSREMSAIGERSHALATSLQAANQSPSITAMDAVLGELAGISADIRSTIATAQTNADDKRRLTLMLVVGLSLLVVAAGIVIGVQQYRSVMRPLRRLGDAVRLVAAGNFSKPIDAAGDREFFELATDFNRMSSELETLYRELEQKVRDKSKELVRSERLASVGYLAAGVAHEINNPLSIITGYGERALRQLDAEGPGAESSRTRKAIEVMCEEAFRCKQITDRLLSLARGGQESFGPVDLPKVAEEVIANLTGLPEYRDCRIILQADPRSPLTIRARDGEMKQVILNLLINALQAGPTGVDTAVAISRTGDSVELSVLDHGRGMDAQTLDRVFEPFFTSQRGSTRGTGLGLSISHAIIADHGGTIAAYSEGVGRGSRFVVRLPAIAQEVIHAQR